MALTWMRVLLCAGAVWALFCPYRGIYHDSVLYAAQVIQAGDARVFANDLFFVYGSQSSFTIFSPIVSPIAAVLGLDATFWLGTVLGTGALLSSFFHLLVSLGISRSSAAFSAIMIAAYPIPYGMGEILHVNENFLTPRLWSAAAVLWSLSALLSNRRSLAGMGLLLACALHPLIAMAGLATALALVVNTWRTGLFVAGSVATLSAGVIFSDTLPRFDSEWLAIVHARTDYNFPSLWSTRDWFNNIFPSLLLAFFGRAKFISAAARRMALTAGLIGLAGVVGSAVAELTTIALPTQLQFYRAQWLALVLVPAFAIEGLQHAHRTTDAPLFATMLLLSGACVYVLTWNEARFVVHVIALPAFAIRLHGLRSTPRSPLWLGWSVAGGMITGACIDLIGHIYGIGSGWARAAESATSIDLYASALSGVDRLIAIACGIFALRKLSTSALSLIAIVVAFTPLILIHGRPITAGDLSDRERRRAVVEFTRTSDASVPVYIPGEVRTLWLDARRPAAFDITQMAGVLFSREVAIEGLRRLHEVQEFELVRQRNNLVVWRWINALLGRDSTVPAPTQLCAKAVLPSPPSFLPSMSQRITRQSLQCDLHEDRPHSARTARLDESQNAR